MMAAFFSLCLTQGPVQAMQVTLAWNASQGATGYLLCYGNQSHDYASSVDVGNVTTYTVSNLNPAMPYYFAVKAYNASGISDFSSEAVPPASQGGGVMVAAIASLQRPFTGRNI